MMMMMMVMMMMVMMDQLDVAADIELVVNSSHVEQGLLVLGHHGHIWMGP